MRRAFHQLQHSHLENPNFDFDKYDMLVCNPSLNPSYIRSEFSHDVLIGPTINAHMVFQYAQNNPWFNTFRSYFEDKNFWGTNENWNAKELKVNFRAYDALLLAIRRTVLIYDWNFIYLDDLWGAMPQERVEKLQASTALEDAQMWNARWHSVIKYFLSQLHIFAISKGIRVVGNTAGWDHEFVNSTTIEASHIFGPDHLVELLKKQDGDLNVIWGTEEYGELKGLVRIGDLGEGQ